MLERVTEDLGIKVNLHEEILRKKDLRNYQVYKGETDGCILIYKNNGRLLLTDKNGIFDDFIRKMCQKNCKKK